MSNESEKLGAFIEEAKANGVEGKDLSKRARGFLLMTFGLEGKEATALLVKAGLGGTRARGFLEAFTDRLREDYLTEEEFELFLNEYGSKNTKANKGHYDNIRKLANDIRRDYEEA